MPSLRLSRAVRPLAGIAAAVVLLAAAAYVAAPPRALKLQVQADPRVVRGSMHVHTVRSDGAGTIDQVAEAAARAGLQFVVLSDHGDGTRPPERPSYRHGVLILDAVEISTDGGHYLALGLAAAPYRLAGEPRDVVADVRRLGGFGIVAHPASPKADLRWREWSAPFDGIEWLNGDSEWRDESRPTLARALVTYGLRAPETIAALFDRPIAPLARWDTLAQRRRVIGTAGHDAHARIGLRGNWEPAAGERSLGLPSYEAAFRAFAVRVELPEPLAGDAEADAAAVLAAIRAGRLYTVLDGLAGPAFLTFEARAGARVARMGQDLETEGPVQLTARVPDAPGVQLHVLRNGRVAARVDGPAATLTHEPAPGVSVYRVEAHLARAPGRPAVPWIVGNPIWIGERLDRDTPPAQPYPAAEWQTLFDGAGAGAWRIEKHAGSHGAIAIEQGPWGSPALRFDFGLQDGNRVSQYAAAVLVPPDQAFAAIDHLAFEAAASRPMRISVQLRDPRTGRRWIRSVPVGREPAEHVIRLGEMVPVEGGLSAPMPRESLDSLLFVVDTVSSVPGSSGTLWLDDVRVGTGRPDQVRTVSSR